MFVYSGGKWAAGALCFVASLFATDSYVRSQPPPVDDLSTAVLAAKADFRPLTEADLRDAEAELRAALARLDARLKAAGPEADGWRSYLRWDAMQDELAREGGPDLRALDEIHAKYAAGHDGLGLVWFADVRRALQDYLITARLIGDPNLKAAYEQLLDALPGRLAAYREHPTAEKAAVLGSVLQWLAQARQAEGLVKDIRRHFSQPNLLAEISADVVAAGIAESMDEVEPVRDVILGTRIYGTGQITGELSVELIPSATHARIDSIFHGTVDSETIGYKGPARIFSDATTSLHTRKPILIDAEGVRALPASSNGTTHSTTKGIQAARGGRFVERVAWKRTCKRKCEAEWIAARHAEQRANCRADQQARELVDRANKSFAEKFRKPLINRRLFPEQLLFTTTDTALHVTCLEAGPHDLGAPNLPPDTVDQPDLAVRVHESMVNHLAKGLFAGKVLEEERLQAHMIDLLGELPERLRSDEQSEPWGITFARPTSRAPFNLPISVAFADSQFSVTIRGRRYRKGPKHYPGMNVTAVYKITETAEGFKAVRQAELQIFPPGFVPGSGNQLSVREQVLRDLLQRRFGKLFEEEIVPEPLVLPGKWEAAGELRLVQWETNGGWMLLAWRRGPADE